MAKRKKRIALFIIITIMAILIFSIFAIVSQPLSISGIDLTKDTVFIPIFTNTECTVIEFAHTDTFDWAERQNSIGWIKEYCSRNDHEVYTNRCELEFNRKSGGIFTDKAEIKDLYICPVCKDEGVSARNCNTFTTSDDRDDVCRRIDAISGTISFTNEEFILARARDALFGSSVDTGELQIRKVADRWGLKTIDSSNFLSKEVTCEIGRIEKKGFTFLKEEGDSKAPTGILPFNSVMNYISAVRPSISKNVIQYKGDIVWTIGNQQVCNVKEDVNNIRFVDVNDCKTASDIICNPALPFCSDDGTKIINIDSTGDDGKECNQLYGSFLNTFIPNSNNADQVCKTKCDSNRLVTTSCKNIPSCGENEVLNAEYLCVSSQVAQSENKPVVDPTVILIILAFIVIILLMVVIRMNQNGGK